MYKLTMARWIYVCKTYVDDQK